MMRFSSFATTKLCLIAGGMLALTAGCESSPKPSGEYLFFPSPPAKPRVQFLTWASGADQVEPQRTALEDFVLGEEPVSQRVIDKPYGLAARDGIVYVCDTKGICISRLDFVNQTFGVFGVTGPGKLRKPINIALDPLGYKFVADAVRNQVVVFGPDDKYVTAFDMPEPAHLVDVAVYGEEVYALDNDESCQVVVMDRKTGAVKRTFGSPGGEGGQFKIPSSICVDDEGFVYVSDTHNWRFHKLTPDGEPLLVKGTPGYRLGEFGRPRGIRVGPDGIIYVVDGATEIVQMFDQEGNTLMRFGGPGDIPGALGLPSTLAIDTTSIPAFKKFAHPEFEIEYLLFVASQYGRRLVNVYAFGAFPEGHRFTEAEIASLPSLSDEVGIGPVEGEDVSADPAQIRAVQPEDDPGAAPPDQDSDDE